MTVELSNPAGVFHPETYFHVATARGSRTLYLSMQVALDVNGELVGPGDLAAQAAQAFHNVASALARNGASFNDVARMTIYVVDWKPAMLEQVVIGATLATQNLGIDPRRAMTLVGVQSLANAGLMIGVEATAVLD